MPKERIKYKAYKNGWEVINMNGNRLCDIPVTLFGKPVMRLGEKLFANNRDAKYVEIPIHITEIANECFYDSLVTSVKALGVKIVEDKAFYNCSNLVYLDIPNMVYVGDAAFCGCELLSRLSLANVAYAGDDAFALIGTDSVYMPKLVSCGYGLFEGCKFLTEAVIGSATKKQVAMQWSIPRKVSYDGYTWIRVYDEEEEYVENLRYMTGIEVSTWKMFDNCTSLTKVDIYAEDIADLIFHNCISLETVYAPLAKHIGAAFGECHSLKVFGNYKDGDKVRFNKYCQVPHMSSNSGLKFRIKVKLWITKFLKDKFHLFKRNRK